MSLGRRAGLAIAVLGLLLLLPSSAWADTTIGFDDLSPGTTLSNQYASAGVVFGPVPGGAAASQPTVVTNVPGQAHSGSHVADIGCSQYQPCPNEGIGTYIPETSGTFSPSAPRSHLSVYVGLLGSSQAPACSAGSAASTCAAVQLLAFDSNGHQVASSPPATVTQGAGVRTQLAVSTASPQIVGFEVTARNPTDNQKDVAIDDLSFDAPSTPPPPDFALVPQSSSLAVAAGHSASDEITIGRLSGSSGQIQLSVGSLPSGVHAQFAPNPADTQTTLTLSADPTVPTRPDSAVTITGTPLSSTAGTAPRSVTISLHVASACDDVLTAQDLINAVGSGCQHIYVDDRAQIDLAYVSLHPDEFPGYDALHNNEIDNVLHIPPDVTLQSDRSTRRAGGLLYMSQNVTYPTAMLKLSSGDHITGLRLDGYSYGRGGDETWTINDPTIGTTDGLNVSQPDVLIDNDEIAGWPGAGVFVNDLTYQNWPPPGGVVNEPHPPKHSPEDDLITALARRVHITNNYIHNNVGCTDGYGVNVGGSSGFALIDRNIFDYDKHDVAGGGMAGTGYIASSNLTLTDGVECRGDSGKGKLTYGGHFDMHGTAPGPGHVGGAAEPHRGSQQRDPRRTAIPYPRGPRLRRRAAFDLRGTPTDKAIFAGNVTEASDGNAVAVDEPIQSRLCCTTSSSSATTGIASNTSQQLAVGDFDGDGCSDVFLPTGAVWVYSPAEGASGAT